MPNTTKPSSKRPSRRPSPAANASEEPMPSAEAVAQRAFELYLERGGIHGHHEEDWLRAERELRESVRPRPS
jgi:hypothetical protein